MKRILLCSFMVLSVISACVSAPPRYSVTWLDGFGGRSATAYDVNDSGQVVGYYSNDLGRERAFSWQGGVVQELDTPDGANARSWARGINDNGQIVGYATVPGQGYGGPCMWQDGTMQALQGAPLGGTACGINDAGQVIVDDGYLWENGQVTDLGGFGGSFGTVAADVNDAGLVVGHSSTSLPNNPSRAFIWKQGRMTDLGTLDGPESFARGINNLGQMVGYSTYLPDTGKPNQPVHAFLWQDWLMYDLGAQGGTNSQANDINDSGLIVGVANTVGGCVWQDRVLYDLDECVVNLSPGSNIGEASAVNNRGQILGRGYDAATGVGSPYLLTPVPVPEPSGMLALTGGLAWLGLLCGRTRRLSR